jgi:hypothetical protein
MTDKEFKEWKKSQEATDALQGVPPLTTGAERLEAIKKLLAEFPDLTPWQARCFVTGETDTKPRPQAAVTRRRIRLLVTEIRAVALEEGIPLDGVEITGHSKETLKRLTRHVEGVFRGRAYEQWRAFHDKVECRLEPFYAEHPEARP